MFGLLFVFCTGLLQPRRYQVIKISDFSTCTSINPLTATSTPTLNFLRLPRVYIYIHIRICIYIRIYIYIYIYVYIYARVEKSLYNRLFISRYNPWLIRLLVQLFPKRVVVVLYIGFQFGTFYSQEYSPGYQNTDPKVEVRT